MTANKEEKHTKMNKKIHVIAIEKSEGLELAVLCSKPKQYAIRTLYGSKTKENPKGTQYKALKQNKCGYLNADDTCTPHTRYDIFECLET